MTVYPQMVSLVRAAAHCRLRVHPLELSPQLSLALAAVGLPRKDLEQGQRRSVREQRVDDHQIEIRRA